MMVSSVKAKYVDQALAGLTGDFMPESRTNIGVSL